MQFVLVVVYIMTGVGSAAPAQQWVPGFADRNACTLAKLQVQEDMNFKDSGVHATASCLQVR